MSEPTDFALAAKRMQAAFARFTEGLDTMRAVTNETTRELRSIRKYNRALQQERDIGRAFVNAEVRRVRRELGLHLH